VQLLHAVGGEDDVGEAVARGDLLRQGRELAVRLQPAGGVEVGEGRPRLAAAVGFISIGVWLLVRG